MSELSVAGLFAWLDEGPRFPSSVPPSPLMPPPNGDTIPPLVAMPHRGMFRGVWVPGLKNGLKTAAKG